MSILELTAVELGKKIKDKEITVVEATKAALEQIKAVESDVHGYVSYDEESALKRAEEVQKGIDDGTYTGPLAGVPMAIKDNICTKGYTTTCSSKILENFVPTYSAQAVDRLGKNFGAGGLAGASHAGKQIRMAYAPCGDLVFQGGHDGTLAHHILKPLGSPFAVKRTIHGDLSPFPAFAAKIKGQRTTGFCPRLA